MKKTLLSFFSLACAISISAQTNLVTNGDFEEWDYWSGTPKNWTLNIQAWTNKSTDAQSGDYSAELESSDTGVGFISTAKFNIVADKTYTCSFYYKITAGSLTKFEATLRHFDNIFPEGLLTQNITYPATGWTKCEFTYTATVSKTVDLQILFWTDDNAKVLLDNVSFAETTTSGINKDSETKAFSIYPNPASDYIVINADKAESIEIYNTGGTLVSKTKANDGNQIDISHLPAGAYIVSVLQEGKVTNAKILKR